jgi:hypothetical protein
MAFHAKHVTCCSGQCCDVDHATLPKGFSYITRNTDWDEIRQLDNSREGQLGAELRRRFASRQFLVLDFEAKGIIHS